MRSGARLTFIALLVCASLASTAARSAANEGAASRSVAKPRWQYLPSLDHTSHGNRLTTVAGASGRAWFFVSSLRGLSVASARARGSRLTSVTTTRVQAPLGWYPIVLGPEVLYSATRSSSGISKLLANGKVGPAEAASPDPMATKVGIPVAAARVGERIVWALAGGVPIGEGINFRTTLHACCDEAGATVDLSSLITRRPAPRSHALGIDAKGRVWLAWLNDFGRRGTARVVELDPTTLARKTAKALDTPVTGVTALKLACAASCRLVIQAGEPRPQGRGFRGYLATWAPGERSVARIDLGDDPDAEHPTLVDAGYRSGRLAVAYLQGSPSPELRIVVGDGRGARARIAGSVQIPALFSGAQIWIGTVGAFTPSGFAFAQAYSNGGAKVRVLATVVPLR